MVHGFLADNDSNVLTDQQLVQAEIDLRRDFTSGYANNARAPVQLQKLFNELSAEQTTKRDQEESLERFARNANEKERTSDEKLVDDLQSSVTQEWLKSRHEFAGMNLTGAEWRHVADYARQNRQRILEEWMQDGLTQEEAETGLKAIAIMGRGGPKTEAEKEVMKQVETNDAVRTKLENITKEAGVDPNTAPKQEVGSPKQPTVTPAPSPEFMA